MGLVVDDDLRVRDVAGLYAVGGSAFPTYGAAWPTLTIAALAIRLGAMLAAA
jgi:choline dehydrogenase-like flavoprotein